MLATKRVYPTAASGAVVVLSTARILEGECHREATVGASKGHGAYRATKSPQVLRACIDLINRGGVAALVPAAASDAYLDEIARRMEYFVSTRAAAVSVGETGILALPTSGSTGTPKLVALPAAGVARFLSWGGEYFGFDASTVSLSLSPWNFDISLLDTWAVLAAHGTVVAADAARLHDAAYLKRLLVEHQPTFVQVVPSTLDALLRATDEASYDSLQHVVLTGGVASQPTRGAAARAFPEAVFHNVYGATEVNDCLAQTLTGQEFAEAETLSLGGPIAGCEVVLHADGAAHPVGGSKDDSHGELLVRTPWMALGYIADGMIQPLPATEVEAQGLLYPMKDLAACTAGSLTYLGRRDRTVKIRGQRINLDEIEQAARKTSLTGMGCAWIEDSAGVQELHLAYTAPHPGETAASGLRLRMQMSRLLPAFAMPNHFHPFAGPFPLNGNGKPDLTTIRQRVESE